MTFSSRSKTKADVARSDVIHASECMACAQLSDERGLTGDLRLCCGPVEEHHTRGRTRKGAHMATIPLGAWHHRAVPHDGWLRSTMRIEYGPSLAEWSKPFHAAFGSDADLLAKQDGRLAA